MSIVDNTARSRFEYDVEGRTAFIDYRRAGNVLSLTHAEVPQELEGRGIGSLMARGALDLVRERGEKVIPVCSFVVAFIRRHPEYQDLLANS
jgi:predicted GNAT family acetyltransferase